MGETKILEILKQFVNDFSTTEYVGAIVGIVVAIATFYNFVSNRLKEEKNEIIEKHIVTSESINAYIQDIDSQINHNPFLYKSLLFDVLSFFNKHLGDLKLFSFKSLSKHYVISFIYSFFFFYFVWLLGGNGQIGTLRFIENIDNKNYITFLIIFEVIIVYVLMKNLKIIERYFSLNEKDILLLWNFLLMVNLIVFSLIYGVYFGLIIFISLTIFGIIILITTSLKETASLCGKVLMLGLGIFSVLGLLLMAWYFSMMLIGVILQEDLGLNPQVIGVTETSIVVFLFALVLPFINAIFDYISMYFSRLFAKNILETDSKFKIFIDVVLDLVIAIVLLYLLAWTLYNLLDLTNIHLIKDKALFIPIEDYKTQLMVNPFNKDVLWITLMFISTLIPTILHLFLATYALMAYWLTKPHLHSLVEQLNELKPNDPDYLKKEKIAKQLVSYRLASMIKVYLFIGSFLLILLGIVVLMLLLKKGLYVL